MNFCKNPDFTLPTSIGGSWGPVKPNLTKSLLQFTCKSQRASKGGTWLKSTFGLRANVVLVVTFLKPHHFLVQYLYHLVAEIYLTALISSTFLYKNWSSISFCLFYIISQTLQSDLLMVAQVKYVYTPAWQPQTAPGRSCTHFKVWHVCYQLICQYQLTTKRKSIFT
jgi:hypothetical protein